MTKTSRPTFDAPIKHSTKSLTVDNSSVLRWKLFTHVSKNTVRMIVLGINAPINNISVILWLSVWFVEQTRVSTDLSQVTDNYRIKWYRVHLAMNKIRNHNFTTLVGLGTDCTSNCKSNYHTITTTTTRKYYLCINLQ